LLQEWHDWDKLHVSENNPVDCFPGDQLFVIFVVADGGVDLEKFVPRDYSEAISILLQARLCLTALTNSLHILCSDQNLIH